MQYTNLKKIKEFSFKAAFLIKISVMIGLSACGSNPEKTSITQVFDSVSVNSWRLDHYGKDGRTTQSEYKTTLTITHTGNANIEATHDGCKVILPLKTHFEKNKQVGFYHDSDRSSAHPPTGCTPEQSEKIKNFETDLFQLHRNTEGHVVDQFHYHFGAESFQLSTKDDREVKGAVPSGQMTVSIHLLQVAVAERLEREEELKKQLAATQTQPATPGTVSPPPAPNPPGKVPPPPPPPPTGKKQPRNPRNPQPANQPGASPQNVPAPVRPPRPGIPNLSQLTQARNTLRSTNNSNRPAPSTQASTPAVAVNLRQTNRSASANGANQAAPASPFGVTLKSTHPSAPQPGQTAAPQNSAAPFGKNLKPGNPSRPLPNPPEAASQPSASPFGVTLKKATQSGPLPVSSSAAPAPQTAGEVVRKQKAHAEEMKRKKEEEEAKKLADAQAAAAALEADRVQKEAEERKRKQEANPLARKQKAGDRSVLLQQVQTGKQLNPTAQTGKRNGYKSLEDMINKVNQQLGDREADTNSPDQVW